MLQRDFTEEQNMFREAYRKFLAAEIVPHMEAWREAGIVDRSAFRKAGEQGNRENATRRQPQVLLHMKKLRCLVINRAMAGIHD